MGVLRAARDHRRRAARARIVVAGLLALLAVLTIAGSAAAEPAAQPVAGRAATPTGHAVPAFGHVFLIIGENADYSHLTATTAPYLTTVVRPHSAWLENYYAATHWSQANYVALASGQFNSCQQHDGGIACHQNVDNIYHQLDQAGSSWKVWLEAGAGRCDGGGSTCASDNPCPLAGFYTTGNPPVVFDDIEGPGGVFSATTPSSECLANDVPAGTDTDPMGTFNSDLRVGAVAAFNTIIPNGCDDGNASCAPVRDRIRQYDNFLAQEVPRIQASPAFVHNGVIIITYDEDQRLGGLAPHNGLGQGGHTACAVISPMVVPGNYATQTYAYSLLRTLQDGFGLSPYLGHAADVRALPVSWN